MRVILAALLLLSAACDREERPEVPTAAEAEQLDEAEQMLNDLGNESLPADSDQQVSGAVDR